MLNADKQSYLTETLELEKAKYNNILTSNPYDYENLFFCLNNIIDQKHLLNYNGSDSIYLDFKKLIKYYIQSSDIKEIGYDNIDISMIDQKLNKLNAEEKYLILKMFRRELRKNSFSDKGQDCEKFIDNARLKYYKENFNLENGIKYLALLSASNIYWLLLTIIMLIILISVIFLPAPLEIMGVIDVSNVYFSKYKFFNNISNILSLLFDLDYKMEVKAINPLGVILLGLLKLLFVSIIINYLWKRVVKYFKIID